MISAWAVGSLVDVTRLLPSPTISPFLTMTQPNGPPSFVVHADLCKLDRPRHELSVLSVIDVFGGCQLDLVEVLPVFAGDKNTVLFGVIGDAVERVFRFRIVGSFAFGWSSGEIPPRSIQPSSLPIRVDAGDVVRLAKMSGSSECQMFAHISPFTIRAR